MNPIGPLMREHRQIEKMIAVMQKRSDVMERQGFLDLAFLAQAVDFVKNYADRIHHGKEEDILFQELAKKNLSDYLRTTMAELVEEHHYGRGLVREMIEAQAKYQQGHSGSLGTILLKIRALAEFYPRHIDREDKAFFPEAMRCLTAEEQTNMIHHFCEFDRKILQEKYLAIIETLEKSDNERETQ
jgi:hemerythrin-like domain-containing protein